jgi:hypothetical protein
MSEPGNRPQQVRTWHVVGLTFIIFVFLGAMVSGGTQPAVHWNDGIESKAGIISFAIGFGLLPALIAWAICSFTK